MVNVHVATIRSKSTKTHVFKEQKLRKDKSVIGWKEKTHLEKIPCLTLYDRCN